MAEIGKNLGVSLLIFSFYRGFQTRGKVAIFMYFIKWLFLKSYILTYLTFCRDFLSKVMSLLQKNAWFAHINLVWFLFRWVYFLQHLFRNEWKLFVYFFFISSGFWKHSDFVLSWYHDSLIASTRFVCSCASQIFKPWKIWCFFLQISSEDIYSYLQNLNLVK